MTQSRISSTDLSDWDRLSTIVKSFVECGQDLEEAAIAQQFKRETGRRVERSQVAAAVKRVMREEMKRW